MNKKEILSIGLISYFCFFIMIGIVVAGSNREHDISDGCIYKSYLSMYNPAFIIGCELAKDRTK